MEPLTHIQNSDPVPKKVHDKLSGIVIMRCLGCGSAIPWDGEGLSAYACPCGATLFYEDGNNALAPPVSLLKSIGGGGPMSKPMHLDYYLGISKFESDLRTKIIGELRSRGSVWSWECGECREHFLRLKRAQRKASFLRFDLHPELEALLKKSGALENDGVGRYGK